MTAGRPADWISADSIEYHGVKHMESDDVG